MAGAEPHRLREYLLRRLPEAEVEQVELRLLSDSDFVEEYDVVVDELIDDYVAGKLAGEDVAQLKEGFFQSSLGRDKLKFAMALKQETDHEGKRRRIQRFFKRYGPIAASVIFVVGSFYVWRDWSRDNALASGLASLQSAFRDERPFEARISTFDYAPYIATRGPGTDKINRDELRLAELTLLGAKKNPTPAIHHGLGKVYLAKKEFDKALEEFDEALKGDPKNAQLHSDLGVAWLEKGKIDRDGPDAGKGNEELGRSLEHFNKALEFNPNLLEALFNRALGEVELRLYAQAESDWRDYLKKDQSSAWAEEARRNLQRLEEQKNKKSQTKEQLLQDFLAAYEARNDDAAWAALSLSRGRTGNLIVESLVDSYFGFASSNRTAEANDELQKLLYAGKVEVEKVGDRFTSDIARVYSSGPARPEARLIQARELMKSATNLYNKAEWSQAIELFSRAGELFSQSAHHGESLFAEAWVGYCHLRTADREKGLSTFEHLSQIFDAKQYKSLLGQSLLAQADALNSANEFSRVLERAQQALAVSEQIQDDANAVRCLQSGTSMQLILGNYRESLDATFQALRLADKLPPDSKLTWPFYHEASIDFYFLGLPSCALLFENEALRLATADGLTLLASRSYDRLAVIFEDLGNYGEALKNSELARNEAQKISDDRARTNILAHSALILGKIYRETGQPKKAVESFDQALALYQKLDLNAYQYQAHKGKMLALLALNDDSAARAELDTVLGLFERSRQNIVEQSYRDKFFETGQDTYDIAVDFAYSRSKDPWKAFEYAETSRARSLVDRMAPTLIATGTFAEIKLPEQTQLLEYAVLDDKVIIWVVTKDGLRSAENKIARSDLNQKIRNYLNALSGNQRDGGAVTNQGKELYDVLIAPVAGYLNRNLQLCVIPDDDLNFLPFASLVSPASGRYLIEDYVLETAPSATVFVTSSASAKLRETTTQERLLVVGNPNFDREQFRDLPDLPAAKREAEEIAALYGATPLVGKSAVLERVTQSLKKSEVVHLATHAVPDESSPLLSKLLLSSDRTGDKAAHHASRGFLQASDIYDMKLPRTRLVVLSACQTGIERSYRGEGAIGLARPFIAAGVPLVIASLWPVESEATAGLMISFHKHRKQDQVSTVEALRRAQLEALHNPQSKTYDWAAFVAIGGYTGF